MKKTYIFIVSFLLSGSLTILNGQTKPSEYKIANKFPIEGDGGWDYLSIDETGGRIFVSHGMVVQVVDEKNGKLLGTIHDTKGVHGIAIASDINKVYISNGRDSSVTIIDLKSLAFKLKVSVTGQNPDAILYDQFSHKVFVYNGWSSNATVIDALSDKVVATITLDGKPEFSVTDGKGNVFVNIEDKSEISLINSSTLKVEKSWSIAPGEEPSGLALDNENHRLFAVCGNKLMVIVDATSGNVITTLRIGDRVDGAAFDPGLKRAYSSNGEGTMTVIAEINPNEYKVLENVQTEPGARTIGVNMKTHHLYLTTAEFQPPAAGSTNPRPAVKPGTFVLLDVVPVK
jgi:DNA-binding beta-propeller fold protein YncE